ncbi:general secretion pathway protein GspB [Lonsdalea britannica]|uniref:general secretion pathway protein GspB n=1 Tax=Lonsdalea britannica TaxID=1082704 RepID=UPI002ADDBAB8|nr:general secretion pathway protein GspB [Lonsdalea britannica]
MARTSALAGVSAGSYPPSHSVVTPPQHAATLPASTAATPSASSADNGKLPAFTYSAHVFTSEPERRSITLNNQRYHEGESHLAAW